MILNNFFKHPCLNPDLCGLEELGGEEIQTFSKPHTTAQRFPIYSNPGSDNLAEICQLHGRMVFSQLAFHQPTKMFVSEQGLSGFDTTECGNKQVNIHIQPLALMA